MAGYFGVELSAVISKAFLLVICSLETYEIPYG